MKVYLFLFPTRWYVETSMTFSTTFTLRNLCVDRLNQIIDARYRQNDYQVYWVLFPGLDGQPNGDLISEHIEIHSQDRLITSTIDQLPGQIIKQLPDGIDRLVLGGFHQWDCVDKVAAAVYSSGINTFVDEDTTELFFVHSCAAGELPLLRPNPTLSGFMRDGIIDNETERLLNLAVEQRQNRPWLTQKL